MDLESLAAESITALLVFFALDRRVRAVEDRLASFIGREMREVRASLRPGPPDSRAADDTQAILTRYRERK